MRIDTEVGQFQSQLDTFAAMQDVPTEELALRSKTALINVVSTLERICLANILPNAAGNPLIRVSTCTFDQKETVQDANYQPALQECMSYVTAVEEKYAFILMSFLEKDVQNKMTYTYATRLQELALALRSVNQQFSYVNNAISYIVSQVTALIHGKNAGK